MQKSQCTWRPLLIVLLCASAFFLGGFYGCQFGTRELDRLGRSKALTEIVHITQTYKARREETGRWPAAGDVVYSDLHPVGSRTKEYGERVDQFPSPYGGSELMEFHLRDDGYIRVELRKAGVQ